MEIERALPLKTTKVDVGSIPAKKDIFFIRISWTHRMIDLGHTVKNWIIKTVRLYKIWVIIVLLFLSYNIYYDIIQFDGNSL